jgi:hypothetical protein
MDLLGNANREEVDRKRGTSQNPDPGIGNPILEDARIGELWIPRRDRCRLTFSTAVIARLNNDGFARWIDAFAEWRLAG